MRGSQRDKKRERDEEVESEMGEKMRQDSEGDVGSFKERDFYGKTPNYFSNLVRY